MSTTGTGTHFKARINQSGHDDTNVLREGAVPIVGATAIGALSLGGVTAALIPAGSRVINVINFEKCFRGKNFCSKDLFLKQQETNFTEFF